jgi:phytoene synthase
MFLPASKRRAVWAVYAFCRHVDDVVDEAHDLATPRVGHLSGSRRPEEALDAWRRSLIRLYERGGAADHPVLCAWSDLLDHYPVPLQPALDLLEGVTMDLAIDRYETFEPLHLYCYRVAGTVGLLTSPIFGYLNEAALEHAVDLGVALQLTNILRDIGEDARRNRIYIPLNEMRQFGYSEGELMAGAINDAFRELVRFQMQRAHNYYQRAQPGILLLSPDCRMAVHLSSTLYRGILDRIRLNNYNVFTRRASVPLKNKLAAVSHHWFQQQWEMRVKGV